MADQMLEAEPVALLDLLEQQSVFQCPMFQRPYVWGRPEIDQLWDDIETVLTGEYDSRFLGAIVLDTAEAAKAKKAGRHWVIDGQQRLTTLFLAIVAISEELAKQGATGEAHDLAREYVLGKRGDIRGKSKLIPTLVDAKQFSGVLSFLDSEDFGGVIDQDVLGDTDGALSKCYAQTLRRVRKIVEDSEDRIAALVSLSETVLDKVEFVEIVLGDRHDANEVFDRLNKEGRRLEIVDLVRNDVMRRSIDDSKTANKLYKQLWRPFEQSFPDAKSRDRYFFPFALTCDPTSTKSRTFHALAARWRGMTEGVENATAATTIVMDDLGRHVAAFVALETGEPQSDGAWTQDLKDIVAALHRMRAPGVSYPYLMQVITAAINEDADSEQSVDALRVVESFLFRRAIAGLEPTGLHAIFKRLYGDAGIDPPSLMSKLQTKTIAFPSDEEFKERIRYGALYTRNVCRYALEEYERHFDAGDVWAVLPDWTVDHVLPRHPAEDSDWWDAFTQEQHQALVDTWANLVPLSGKANSEKGNSGWEATRSKLQTDSVFKSTTKLLNEYDDWTPGAIQERSEVIASWAVQRWPKA